MSAEAEKRDVSFGCAVWVGLGLLIGALWGIDSTLRKIDQHIVIANCLTEAAHGVTCPEAKRK